MIRFSFRVTRYVCVCVLVEVKYQGTCKDVGTQSFFDYNYEHEHDNKHFLSNISKKYSIICFTYEQRMMNYETRLERDT